MEKVSIERFAKDHWSLLAYVESQCVDSQDSIGRLQRNRMRCNSEKNPQMSAGLPWRDTYSSRMQGSLDFNLSNEDEFKKAVESGAVILGHDDWDCLDDLDDNGLVEIISLANCAVTMTKKGMQMAAKLREHKANGGNFAGFKAA